MAGSGMNWWNNLVDWLDGEDTPAPPVDAEAQRAQQLAARWRQAVAPTTAPRTAPATDPLQSALDQWRLGQQPTPQQLAPMQGPLRPGETRPMLPAVGPQIRPPAAPEPQQPPRDPWMDALDTWRLGPPPQPDYNPLSSANTGQPARPAAPDLSALTTFNVQPTTVDFALNRPDTGVNAMTGQQQQAPTVASNQPMQGPQPYQPQDWLTQAVGNWVRPATAAASNLEQGVNRFAQNAIDIGPVDATLGLLEGTPGYDKFMLGAKENVEAGSNHGWDRFKDDFWNSANALDALTFRPIVTAQVPGTGALLGGENVSVGQLASAAGEMINRTLNPLNPNQVDASFVDLAKDLFDGGPNQARQLFWDNLRQSQAVRLAIDSLPEELRTQANVAMVNLISGPDAVKDAADAVLNQDKMVADLEQKAQQAQAAGNVQQAAEFGAQANELKNKTKSELIDEHANPWAEFLGGVLLDPTTYITGGGQEAIQAAKSSALMNLSPEDALKALDGVMDNVTKAATGGNVAGWWQAVNPFARTIDTQATTATDTLWRAAANIMADVTNKEQAKAVLDLWTGDPRQLVEGVVLPGSTEISKWGGGVVANNELLQQYPLLVKARDALLNMRSIAGDPATFSPVEFFAEMNNVLYKQSRELFGLQRLDELPGGAANFRTVKTANGTSVIEYLDKTGKVLKTSAEMLPYDAELYAKNLKKAITAAGPGGQNPLSATWGLQKAILSDMYLGMSPGYWIKNATSAAATMLTDNTMTLLPTKEILNDFMMKFGGVAPTTRSAEAAGSALGQAAGEAMGGLHWAERLFGSNPIAQGYSNIMKRLYQIPFGATDIAGRIPFGEQNFALRATYVPFKRYLSSQWGDAAKGFEQTLTALGIEEGIAKSLASTVADVGINGNKSQLQQVMKKLTTAQVVPFSLKELGVPDELISAPGWAQLNTLLTESLPNQLDEAAAKVSEIFGQEFRQAGELLNSAPPQPGRYVWTEFESVQDGADVVDGMVDAAKRAGLPADQMRQEAQTLMKQISDTETALWTALRGDLAGATDAGSLNVAMDLLAKWYDWRQAARAQVDALSKQAITTNTADAWAKKFEGTRQIYGQFPQWFQGATDEARQNLIKLSQGGQVEGGYDWWNVIKRYASYDEAEVRAARTAGMGVGSPQALGDTFVKALDANRQYVDKSVVELFSAFRKYPSQGALDLMADGIRKMEDLGAKAASFLAAKRATMLPEQADAYYKLRNNVWAEFFDNAVVHNNVVKRLIVASGVADMAKGALKWTDDFAGGEFQLVGKLDDGFWQARNLATGELEKFADPIALAQKRANKEWVGTTMPTVPLATVQDFYRVIGENTNIVDRLIAEADADAAARYAAQEAEMMKRAAEWTGEAPPIRWAGNAPDMTAPAVVADQAAEMAAGYKEARLALRDEWDRVAKATGGYPKIDQLIATYTRDGIINVPENLFEDLYGQTVAGRTLNNQADIERFLQEYYDLGQQAKNAPATMERAATNFVSTPTETDFGAGLGQVFGQLIDALQGKRVNPYTLTPTASGWNPWGIAESAKQTDLYKLVSGINGNLADLLGRKAPEVGEVAQHTIRTLADAERKIIQRLPEILAGKPNTMTPAQQLRVLDALQEMLPQYDNILAGAARTGEQMANYAMLNYNDKRNLDVWMASLMPYHYFWSRSAKNWLQRAVQKPGVVNMWYESQRAIEMENNQNNIPEHLRGTIQNPLPFGPDRLLNPLTFALPFAMYLGSDFVNPDEARSEFERWKMTVQKYTPAMYPLADYATKAILDQTNPLPGGKRRTDEFQLGDVLPLYKMAGYGYQAATGDMSMSQGPLGYGDEYDYGRAGKQVALAGLRGDVAPNDAMWASDVGYQQQTGAQPLPEQQGQGVGAWQQGAQAAGWDRLMNRAGAFLTGVPGYNLSPEEQQMRDMKAQRVQLGYNEVSNPYGSKEAVNAYTNMQPEQFDATFNYSALYPSSDTTKRLRPGEKAVQTEYYNQHGAIMNDMTQAVAKFLVANPNATTKELNEFKAPYWDKVETLKGEYPSLPSSERKNLNTKYMNPVEHAAGFVQSILSHKPAGQPVYPGKDATAEAKKEYYLAKAKWDTERLDYYDRQFTQLLNQDDTYPDPWKEAARKMVKDMYASELLRGYENRYAGDVEKAWSDRQSFVEEVQDAQYKLNDKNVLDRVGQQGSELLSQYYALPKGSEERKAFKRENPLVQAAIMASFQPAEYDEFIQKFGPDAFAMIANAPQHPGDGASEAQLQQYYTASAAFNDQYPNAEAAKLWLNGRRFGAAEGQDSYGAAYDEAIAIFGPNIFDIMANVPQGKDAFVAWMKSNPEQYMLYTGYKEWKKEYADQDKATVGTAPTPEDEAIIPNAGAGQDYTGPRPVGSERQPLGQFDPYATTPEQQIPNAWTARNWDELLQKPADNPWTQRANELNAALLGDQPIPSQMASPTTQGQMGPQTQAQAGGNDAATGSADLKTAREYASMNDRWVKGEMTRQEWAARRGAVNGYFGAGGAKMFDEYYNLPKGPQREEYLKNNPVMRAINLYAYNSKELAPALKMFGDDALGQWALTPAYADTPEAKQARGAYYDKNPNAFLFGAWLNGRPANYDESKEGSTDFKYNFGADFDEAKKLFGDGIWDTVSQFKRGWNATQKRMWYEKHPEYNAWADWWYGREKRQQSAGRASGGGGGFGGGYKRVEPDRRKTIIQPNVGSQYMSGGLAEPIRMAGYQNPSMDWLRSGQELKPGKQIKDWSPEWIRAIKK